MMCEQGKLEEMKPIRTENVMGYEVVNAGATASVDAIMDWIASGNGCRWLACLNPHSYAISLKDERFAGALRDVDWLIPDGIGIVLASHFFGGRIRERVTGGDIFTRLNERLNRSGGARVFFLGATEETLSAIRNRMTRDHPNIRIVGAYSPPFKPIFSDEDNARMTAAINTAKPDILWVGMTSPKQDMWIHENRNRLGVKFAAGIGAEFDFYAEKVKRSHPVFQQMGLQWLPRLIHEPRRLWRRMGISAPIFIKQMIMEKVRLQRDRSFFFSHRPRK